jgi:hypothetical protein
VAVSKTDDGIAVWVAVEVRVALGVAVGVRVAPGRAVVGKGTIVATVGGG